MFGATWFWRGFLQEAPSPWGSFLCSPDGCHHGDTSLPLSSLPSLELPVEFLRLQLGPHVACGPWDFPHLCCSGPVLLAPGQSRR